MAVCTKNASSGQADQTPQWWPAREKTKYYHAQLDSRLSQTIPVNSFTPLIIQGTLSTFVIETKML